MSESASFPAPTRAPVAAARHSGRLRRRIRWRRLLGRGLLGLVILIIVARFAVVAALPGILDRVARQNGLTIHWERLDLSLLSGELELAHLAVAPLDGSAPVLALGYLRVDVETAALFRKEIRIRRVEVDGLDALVERGASGELAILETIAKARAARGEKAPPPEPKPSPAPKTHPKKSSGGGPGIAFVLEALRVQHVHVTLRDASVTPRLDAKLDLDLRLSDVVYGTRSPRPAQLELSVTCPPVLDALRVEGKWDAVGKDALGAMSVALDRLNLRSLTGYLAPLGIEPVAHELSAGLELTARAHPSLDAPDAFAATVSVERIGLRADGTEVAGLDQVLVDAPVLSPDQVTLHRVLVDGIRAGAARAADGSLLVAGLRIAPPPKAALAGAPKKPDAAPVPSAPPAPSAPALPEPELDEEPASDRFRFVVDDLTVRNARASFHDDAVTLPAPLAVVLDHATVTGLVRDAAGTAPARIDVRLGVPGVADSIALVGTAVPFAGRKSLDLALALEGLAPRALAPYLAAAHVTSLLESGSLGLELHAEVEPPAKDRPLAASVALSKLSFADGRELAGLDLVRASGVRFDPERLALDVDEVEVAGPRVEARRESTGALVALGFRVELPKASGNAAPETASARAPGASPAADATPPSAPSAVAETTPAPGRAPSIRLGHLSVHDVRARFVDALPREPATLAVADAGLDLRSVSLDLAADAPAPASAPLRAWVAAPGLAGSVAIVGSLTTSPHEPRVTLVANVDEITLAAAAPYLAAAGIQSELEHGSLELALHAAARLFPGKPIEASAAIDRLRFFDRRASGERELATLEDAGASGVRLVANGKTLERVEVEKVSLGHLHVVAARRPGNVLAALGLAIAPRPPSAGTAAIDSAANVEPAPRGPRWPETAPPPEPPRPPVIAIAKLSVGEVALDLHDGAGKAPVDLPLRAGVALGPIAVDLSGHAKPEPAPFTVELAVPGTLDRLLLGGSLAASPAEAHVRAALHATGIRGGALGPVLEAAGIEPLLRAGSFGLELSADATIEGKRAKADLALEKLAFADRGQELLGIDAVRVRGVQVEPGKVSVGEVEVVRPRAVARREASGALVAGGVRLAPRPPAPATPTSVAPSSGTPEVPPEPVPGPGGSGAQGSGADVREVASTPLVVEVGAIRVRDAGARFEDAVPSPAVSLEPTAEIALEGLVLGREASPARLHVGVTVPGLLQSLAIDGTLETAPGNLATSLEIAGRGLEGSRLAAYLGPRTRLAVEDGRLGAHVEARLEPAKAGGQAARLAVTNVVYRDGAQGPPLFALDSIKVIASRLDPAGGHVALDEVSIAGVVTGAERDAKGVLHVLGMDLAPPPTPTATKPQEGAKPDATPPTPDASKPHEAAAPVRHLRLKRDRYPLVEIAKLDLELRSLAFADHARAGSEPVQVSGLHVRSLKPLSVLGPDPASRPALELELTTEVAPVVSSVKVDVRVAPFAIDPELAVDVAIDGLRGAGLTRVAPELAGKLDGTPLADGRVRASLTVDLKTGRRNPLDFDLSKGFAADLLLRKVDVRDGEKGPVLAGLDELHVDVAKIAPLDGSVHVRSVEISRPAGLVTQEPDGLHVLGLVLKAPPKPAPGTEVAVASPEGTPGPEPEQNAPATSATPTSAAPGTPAPEVRVDRVVLSDIAFDFRDTTCEPALRLPLTGLDVEVDGFTTRALTERRSIRFDAVVKAGKVPLPKKEKKHAIGVGTVLGALSGLEDTITGGEKKGPELEDRLLFQEISVKGELAIAPVPFGRIDASIESVELADFTGAAKKAGVELEEGTLDVESEIHFNDRGDLHSKTDVTFTDLDVSEPAGGPIQRILQLPAPLNGVVFVLRDEDGAIQIPLPVDVSFADGLSGGEIAKVTLRVLGSLIEKAIERSPFRVIGGVGDLGKDVLGVVPGSQFVPGLGGDTKAEETPVVLGFAPGDTALSTSDTTALASIAKRLAADDRLQLTLRHDVGGGDMARARVTSSPGAADRRDLVARLTARRGELEREREDAVAEERAALVAGLDADASSSRRRVLSVDSELAKVERGLDQVYDLAREGAERQAERRARQACLELAKARLEAVRQALEALGVEHADERIRIARPRVEELPGAEGGAITALLREKKSK